MPIGWTPCESAQASVSSAQHPSAYTSANAAALRDDVMATGFLTLCVATATAFASATAHEILAT